MTPIRTLGATLLFLFAISSPVLAIVTAASICPETCGAWIAFAPG